MGWLKRRMVAANDWQLRHRRWSVPWAVIRKFSADQAGLLVVALGWYGFTAIYPLLLIVVTVFGFIGVSSLGTTIVSTLHQFPVIGEQFTPGQGARALHGSVAGLTVGVLGLLYGAQGVTQTAETAMNRVWNVPQVDRPGFVPRLGRSLAALTCIGGAFAVNALVGSLATTNGQAAWVRVGLVAGQLVLNTGFYLGAFRVLLAGKAAIATRSLLPGAAVGAVGFTALITVGTGLVQHQLRNQSATYGAFASVIGVVTFLLILGRLSLYAAELNPVLARGLYPCALPLTDPLPADLESASARALEERAPLDELVDGDSSPSSPPWAAGDPAPAPSRR